MEIEGKEIPSVLPPYMLPRNPSVNPVKELKEGKFGTFTLFLSEEVPFEGKVLGKIPQLNMEGWDFNYRRKYP